MDSLASLAKRVNVIVSASTTSKELAEMQRDPWSKSAKYGYGFVYFAIILLVITSLIRFWHIWGDKIRIAKFKEQRPQFTLNSSNHSTSSPDEYELPSAGTDASSANFFASQPLPPPPKRRESIFQRIIPLQRVVALMRWVFYRPMPVIRVGKLEFVFPSLAVTVIVFAALIFVTLYCFVPQPLYYWIASLAIRAGMLAVAMVPWIVALSTKANIISLLTGLGPERLNGLHRWSAYICLFLSLVHMVPFYVTPIWKDGAIINYSKFVTPNMYVYGTGLAAITPLFVLCVHSLPFLRHWMYELFVIVHIPVSWIFVAMLFWHTKNFLSSWGYLWTTVVIWITTYIARLFYLNWTNPFRLSSFLIGEESAITVLPQGALKVTIPTKMRWRPGQYVYLRMPSVAFFDNHPFTIASLCSDDFPSAYGEKYRDCTLVFRPFKGFTHKVLKKALENGPFKTYTAFLEGPYGGMQREMAAFDDVIFFAGGSGITAIASQLLDLIKKIRDGKAITRSVKVIWALKTPETMEWFQEELRICRDHAPVNVLQCHFFLTGVQVDQAGRDLVQEKIYDMLQGIDKRNSAYIREEAAGDAQREKELRHENQDGLAALPGVYTAPHVPNTRHYYQPYMNPSASNSSSASNSNIPFDFGFGSPQPKPQKAPTPRYAVFHPSQRREKLADGLFPSKCCRYAE
ncbi:hypothetical protein N7462_001100 [Penicillium macrosclerotiorum]|uniref:uncharacterized protein n=1 Tax=Penicillium macrosclerotiorum TaxID=303699 RepID=UPI002548B4BE|nr:uncharacterized protein N7462_001100 [Penicillium macrosclerotiorum]KAJ5699095.1 hypothetical protein N7462_001100 [Penicillium macrosclerotiorum]